MRHIARQRPVPFLAAALAAVATFATLPARAAEPYVAGGFPYAIVGVAQPINANFGVRADFGTISQYRYSGSTADDDFKGSVHYNRTALLGDWFVAGGGFRISGGAVFNQAKATLRATPQGGRISIGGVDYNASGDTYFVQSELSLPKVAPYIGLGWGHHQSNEAGFSFNVDAGAAIGTAKATPLTLSPALASEVALSTTGQADVARENRDYQDEVHKFKAVPQLTVGVGYRF